MKLKSSQRERSITRIKGICNGTATEAYGPPATLLFLHIFKAAGSTTRDTLKEFAKGCNIIYASCGTALTTGGNFIVLKDGKVRNQDGKKLLRRSHVVAGHLWYGVHQFVRHDAVYVTCLRKPFEVAISAKIYTLSR